MSCKLCGIIAEYNPFHNGHAWQAKILREEHGAQKIAAVMSGNFTQRGEAACLDKATRARLAVAGGVDLVVELPFAFAVQSAQNFARGGVRLLAAMGVDAIAFGAPCTDLRLLKEIAAAADTERVQRGLNECIQSGGSYAAAFADSLQKFCGAEENILREPNNILAIEYLRALKDFPAIVPILTPRRYAQHNDDDCSPALPFAGGRAIRRAALNGDWANVARVVPQNTLDALQKQAADGFFDTKFLLRPLIFKLLTATAAELKEIHGINEGLEYKFLRTKFTDLPEFVDKIYGKRYPKSRINRTVLYILTNLTKETAAEFNAAGAAYIRPLTFNGNGQKILRCQKTACALPVVGRIAKFLAQTPPQSTAAKMLRLEVLASDIFALCRERVLPSGADYTLSPIFI